MSIPEEKPKYARQWNESLVEDLYEAAKAYCRSHNTFIECLTLTDFEEISQVVDRPPLQCMQKVRSAHISGTVKAGVWSTAEDELLKSMVTDNWKQIATNINSIIHGEQPVRTAKQCSERWNNHLNPKIKKGTWTHAEDRTLIGLFREHGNKWEFIATQIGTRTGTMVKNRVNSLISKCKRPGERISKEELVNRLFSKYS